jgi:hypothetical protein
MLAVAAGQLAIQDQNDLVVARILGRAVYAVIAH